MSFCRSMFAVGLCLLIFSGCRSGSAAATPPEIAYGADICDECKMIIGEERYAAAYVTTDGTVRRFDDIGGLLAYQSRHNESVAVQWVHDVNTSEWLDAGDAFFVVNSGLLTPMGHGIVACAEEEAARALAFGQAEAEVMTFTQLRSEWEPIVQRPHGDN